GACHVRGDRPDDEHRVVSEVALPSRTPTALGPLLGGLARQRELSLVIVMLALGAFVYWRAPQFVSPSNLSQVFIEASIIAIAATGQAVVVITRNVDLSVDAIIGVVAFSVADILRVHALPLPLAMAYGVGLGLVLGFGNGLLVSWL